VASRVGSRTAPGPVVAGTVARARALDGDKIIARVLRTGALASGGLFFAALVLTHWPASQAASIAVDYCRKGGIALLLATPIVRLITAGLLLGLRGEWRYCAYTAGVLLLLAFAVGAGYAA
jgi:hypothetical protein